MIAEQTIPYMVHCLHYFMLLGTPSPLSFYNLPPNHDCVRTLLLFFCIIIILLLQILSLLYQLYITLFSHCKYVQTCFTLKT